MPPKRKHEAEVAGGSVRGDDEHGALGQLKDYLANEWSVHAPALGLRPFNVKAQLAPHRVERVELPANFAQTLLFQCMQSWSVARRDTSVRLRALDAIMIVVMTLFCDRVAPGPGIDENHPLSRIAQRTVRLSFAAAPVLVVLALPEALTDAERVAAVCGTLAALSAPTGTYVICTDGSAYSVYVRSGKGFSLVEDMNVEFSTPGEYGEGMGNVANLLFSLLLDSYITALKTLPESGAAAADKATALGHAESARRSLAAAGDVVANAYAAEKAGTAGMSALGESLRRIEPIRESVAAAG